MADFKPFSAEVHQRYSAMAAAGELYTTLTGDELWAAYLGAFPEGSNPIFRERTEHDCSCCRNFIKNLGGLVAVGADGHVSTVWDTSSALPEPYGAVADAMREAVLGAKISGIFRTKERSYGAATSLEQSGDKVITWNHFHGKVAPRHLTNTPDQVRGEYATGTQVLKRGLEELQPSAFDTVIYLIKGNNLYRGEENLQAVERFQKIQRMYNSGTQADKELLVAINGDSPAARFRNTAIGTLLVDLSEGVELEKAVASFESKVAPTNYKRTTALVTERMIKDALQTIEDLGLESALERRHAVIGDVNVNDVLWVDNAVRGQMKGGLAGLMEGAAKRKDIDVSKAEDISISDFMSQVAPTAQGMDVFFANNLQSNLVSLTAPVHADVSQLFKWDNNFAWSYNGNITDSIKEKVKRAGGNTGAALRVSLAWFNPDDLDIHCKCPDGHVNYADKMGILDVDMNAYGKSSATEPVENLSWTRPKDGEYQVVVHQYNRRTAERPGFVIEVECGGQVQQYAYDKPVTGQVEAMRFKILNGQITNLRLGKDLVGGGVSQDVWGLQTEQFIKVKTVMHSPNHWGDNAIGNRHSIFVLDGCLNPEETRGIYNEFLLPELDRHRKVFEILGSRTKCPVTTEQLSGLGFSSTRGDQVKIRVTTEKTTKIYNVKF